MKKNILQQVGTREEQYTVTVTDTPEAIDETTCEIIPAITHTETRTRTVPIMQSVTVDMTPEEEAEILANTIEHPAEPTIAELQEQISQLNEVIDTMLNGGEPA